MIIVGDTAMIKILASIALILGGLIAVFNWHSIYASRRCGRFVSAVPLVGGALLVIGLLGFSRTRPYAWLGVIADYGTLSLLCAIPLMIREAWQTSAVNLLHRFISEANGRHCDIRLFKRSRFTVKCEHEPPFPCNGHGALVQSYGFVGDWHEQEDGFRLESYAGDRALEIHRSGDNYITREMGYPSDTKYPYDKLDSLELTKIK